VSGGNVPDFVPEHAGQFGFVAQVREQSARDVDETAGESEGVHGLIVEHGEGPWQLRPVRHAGDPFADAAHVALHLVVVVDAHLAPDLGVATPSDLDLFRFADKRDFALSGDRIRGAGRGEEGAAQREPERAVVETSGRRVWHLGSPSNRPLQLPYHCPFRPAWWGIAHDPVPVGGEHSAAGRAVSPAWVSQRPRGAAEIAAKGC
jgi:hypothetical protein